MEHRGQVVVLNKLSLIQELGTSVASELTYWVNLNYQAEQSSEPSEYYFKDKMLGDNNRRN